MHRNPVKRGLVQHAKDWAWSSFTHYATGAEGIVEIESEWTARRRECMRSASKLPVQKNPRPSEEAVKKPLSGRESDEQFRTLFSQPRQTMKGKRERSIREGFTLERARFVVSLIESNAGGYR